MLPSLTLSIIRYVSRVNLRNPGKGVVPSPTLWSCSYWKGYLPVALDYGHQLYICHCFLSLALCSTNFHFLLVIYICVCVYEGGLQSSYDDVISAADYFFDQWNASTAMPVEEVGGPQVRLCIFFFCVFADFLVM